MEEKIIHSLLLETHAAIEAAAEDSISNLTSPEVGYPPNAGFTDSELTALKKLNLSEDAKTGLIKLIRDACSYPVFHLLSLMDGVTDPDSSDLDEWEGVSLSPKQEDDEDGEMMHEAFFDSYWDYEKTR